MSEPELAPGVPEYEFSHEQNQIMLGLSGSIVMVSIATILLSSLNILLGMGHAARHGISAVFEVGGGIVGLLIGLWLMTAAHAFDQVAKTQGTDIKHLMDAMATLRRIFRLQSLLMMAQAVLIVVVLVLSLKV